MPKTIHEINEFVQNQYNTLNMEILDKKFYVTESVWSQMMAILLEELQNWTFYRSQFKKK